VTEPASHTQEEILRHFGGRVSLAFVNTILWRRSDTPRELVDHYGDVVDHLSQLGALRPEDDRALRAAAAAHPAEAEAALARVLELRELLFRLTSAQAAGQAPAPADLDGLNAAVGAALSHAELLPDGHGYRRAWHADGAAALQAPVWEIARDAYELLLDAEALPRLKQCPGPQCGWVFLDESRNRSRRWCDPKLCGNRERVKSHYRRRRAGQASTTP
jgi:predicted RNA-binding Zn ribbon-like protein